MSLNLGVLNPEHKEIFQSTAFEQNVRGGANAGKSYSIAEKLMLQPYTEINKGKRLKALVIRKTFPSIRNSVIDIMETCRDLLKVPLKINKSEWTAQIEGMKFIFLSLNNKDDYQKVKSVTDVDFVWFNEITEILENDYEIVASRVRGGQSAYKQIIGDYNPIGKTSWVYKRFFEKDHRLRKVQPIQKLRYTIHDNPWAKPEEIEQLESYKESNYNLYKILFLGEWGELEGVIFDWDIVPLPDIRFDEIFYGGDFGYVNPSALVRVYRTGNEFWIEELFYKKNLTNKNISDRMRQHKIGKHDDVYFDCAEPKSIQEIYEEGFNAKRCKKGSDSVRNGINYLRQQKIHILEGSENIIKECRSYVWKKDKDNNELPVPIDVNNHTMDAIRYAIHTHCKAVRGFAGTGETKVY